MTFLVQFEINKHLKIFSKTTNCTHPTGSCNFGRLLKNLLVLIYFKLHSKSCDYVYLIIVLSFDHCSFDQLKLSNHSDRSGKRSAIFTQECGFNCA